MFNTKTYINAVYKNYFRELYLSKKYKRDFCFNMWCPEVIVKSMENIRKREIEDGSR